MNAQFLTDGNTKVVAVLDPTLMDKVLGYQNPEFIERLKHKLGLSHEDAEVLFHDMKQFLYLCGTRPGVWSPTEQIDAAWHEFILYTKDYAEFCKEIFGKFVHHVPNSYLTKEAQLVGNTWRTYKVALHHFGELSSNWHVPEAQRPRDKQKFDNVAVLESDACDSCGCNSCNSCGGGNGCSSD